MKKRDLGILAFLAFLTVASIVGWGGDSNYHFRYRSMRSPVFLAAQAAPNPTPTSMSYPIKYVFVIVQENRSLDNIFNGFCTAGNLVCADTVTTDPWTGTPLVPQNIATGPGEDHSHRGFVTQYNYGKMNGFDPTAYVYVPQADESLYFNIAHAGVFSDYTFQMNQGPSFPNHQYLIAGQSGGYNLDHKAFAENNGTSDYNCGDTAVITWMPMQQSYPGVEVQATATPCSDYKTILDSATNAGLTWRYYAHNQDDIWSAPPTVKHIYNNPAALANVVFPNEQILVDMQNANFANLTYIIPHGHDSDHPGQVASDQSGQQWVAYCVNAIRNSAIWNQSAILITWDDWGGFYDHVPPPVAPWNPYEYGFRVPLIIISPYVKAGTIDHTVRTQAAILHFAEDVLGIQTLGTLDVQTDDLLADFDFSQAPSSPTAFPVNPSFTPGGGLEQ